MDTHSPTHTSPRVLLVEDSLVELSILKKLLEDNDIQVVGTAVNGVEALQKIPLLNPDVICTDYHMPEMDGMVLTQRVMAQYPRPILVLSISAQPYQVQNILNILKAGALDVMAKPLPYLGGVAQTDAKLLVEKIRILSGVKIIAKPRKKPLHSPCARSVAPTAAPRHWPHIIGIGSSTGGPQALLKILSGLPASFSVPVVCVQHISAGFMPGFVAWLNDNSRLTVVSAESGMLPHAGYVYVAPERHHLVLDAGMRFRLQPTAPEDIYKPSVDRLFLSLAQACGDAGVGLVLSGMGTDGAQGVRAIHQQGGLTLAQDEASSVIFGMPKAAIDTGCISEVLALDHISARLLKLQTPTPA
jgi:two-component system chemotaxis response regulator CheB